MYGRSIILALFILFSCQNKGVESDFYFETSRRWIAATKVSWISKHFQQDIEILEPKGTWQAILEVTFLDQDFNEVSDCLFYQVPGPENEGILKITANRSGAPCENLLGEEEYASLSGIVNFGYLYRPSEDEKYNLILKIDTHKLQYNFFNFGLNKQSTELLSSSVLKRKHTGALISSEVNYKVRYPLLKEGETCFNVSNQCDIILKDKCSRCQFGYYKTVSSSCKSLYKKVCGQDKCGTKGNPACLRGYLASGIDPKHYCINDSPVGICQSGLKIVCVNGTLICE